MTAESPPTGSLPLALTHESPPTGSLPLALTRHVWYAGYGSNVSRRRFERYLQGGTPTGGRRRYPGARDRTPPSADRPYALPYRLHFGGSSRTWGGGMAFVDTTCTGHVLARAYRVTAEQFADIHAQENGGAAEAADLSLVRDGECVVAGRGNYPVIVCCGRLDGLPVFSFTAARMPPPTAPRPAYLRTIAAGLAESHGLTPSAIVAYLRGAPVVRAAYDPPALSAVVRAGVTDAIVAPPTHSSPS
jgi:hypothetical protein